MSARNDARSPPPLYFGRISDSPGRINSNFVYGTGRDFNFGTCRIVRRYSSRFSVWLSRRVTTTGQYAVFGAADPISVRSPPTTIRGCGMWGRDVFKLAPTANSSTARVFRASSILIGNKRNNSRYVHLGFFPTNRPIRRTAVYATEKKKPFPPRVFLRTPRLIRCLRRVSFYRSDGRTLIPTSATAQIEY